MSNTLEGIIQRLEEWRDATEAAQDAVSDLIGLEMDDLRGCSQALWQQVRKLQEQAAQNEPDLAPSASLADAVNDIMDTLCDEYIPEEDDAEDEWWDEWGEAPPYYS